MEALARVAPFLLRLLKSAVRALIRPEAAVQEVHASIEARIADAEERARTARTLDEQMDLCEWLCYNSLFPCLLPRFIPLVVVGYGCLAALHRLSSLLARSGQDIPPQLALDLTRGLPNNVTTEMDLALWQVAQRIREDADGASSFSTADAKTLAHDFEEGEAASIEPDCPDRVPGAFMECAGWRRLISANLVGGRCQYRLSLRCKVICRLPTSAPRRTECSIMGSMPPRRQPKKLAAAATQAWRSPLAGWFVRWLAKRVRVLAGLRESPKFTLIRLIDIVRLKLIESGKELVERGVLDRADDLFYLNIRELRTLAMNAPGDWQALVRARRVTDRYEQRRQPIPRLLLSDGTAIFAGLSASANADTGKLVGSGVSPGIVEGTVRVVFSPANAEL